MKKIIANVQMMRFMAAAMVLFSHVQHQVDTRNFLDKTHFTPFNPVFWAGGVDIFFVISGFIMYHLAKDNFGKPNAAPHFVARRIVRVAPLYWAFTTLMLPAVLLFGHMITHNQYSFGQIIASYLFFPWPNPYGGYYPVLILGWTLNFEIMFYMIMAAALMLDRVRGLILAVGILLALGLTGMFFKVSFPPFAFWCNPIVLEFIFGMGLAYVYNTGWRIPPLAGWAVFITGVVLMCLFMTLGFVADNWLLRPFWMGIPALVVCAGAALSDTGETPGPVGRALSYGGDTSYALYLSHPWSIGLATIIFNKLGLHNPWAYVGFTCLFALVAGAVVYQFFERPMTGFLGRRLNLWLVKNSGSTIKI